MNPKITEEQQVYFETLTGISVGIGGAMRTIQDFSAAVGQDVNLVRNEHWLTKVSVAVATIRVSATRVDEMDAPEGFGAIHGVLRNFTTSAKEAADLYALGLEALDGQLIRRATVAMGKALAQSEGLNLLLEERKRVVEEEASTEAEDD